MLASTTEGWSDDLRMQYWTWLNAADDRAGGFSLRGFIEQVKRDALKNVNKPAGVPDAQPSVPATPGFAAAPTSSTLHAWTVDELASADPAGDGVRDVERGARVFREATCILCHRVGGEGATTGPDLTGAGGRFSRTDLLRAILEPSALVSDQYREVAIELKDGDLVVGRIVADAPEYVEVRTNPLTEDRQRVHKSDIASKTVLETSSMPRGLLDARTRAEVLDLLAFLEAGGVK
jgi:putative heme-binding domain-containing protein